MAYEYRIKDQHAVYFITSTVHQWADVFARQDYVNILIESLKYCQKEKGLKIYGWVIMSNHIYLIVQSDKIQLSDIIRDLKKFTATRIIKAIENNLKESRKKWLLWLLKKEEKVWFWEEGYHGEEIYSESFFKTKLDYIHLNPVRAGIVEKQEEYVNSSCGDYYGTRKGSIELAEL
jgi:REP element-mobilizing transposase RayT